MLGQSSWLYGSSKLNGIVKVFFKKFVQGHVFLCKRLVSSCSVAAHARKPDGERKKNTYSIKLALNRWKLKKNLSNYLTPLCDFGSQAINIMHFKHMLTQFYVWSREIKLPRYCAKKVSIILKSPKFCTILQFWHWNLKRDILVKVFHS